MPARRLVYKYLVNCLKDLLVYTFLIYIGKCIDKLPPELRHFQPKKTMNLVQDWIYVLTAHPINFRTLYIFLYLTD